MVVVGEQRRGNFSGGAGRSTLLENLSRQRKKTGGGRIFMVRGNFYIWNLSGVAGFVRLRILILRDSGDENFRAENFFKRQDILAGGRYNSAGANSSRNFFCAGNDRIADGDGISRAALRSGRRLFAYRTADVWSWRSSAVCGDFAGNEQLRSSGVLLPCAAGIFNFRAADFRKKKIRRVNGGDGGGLNLFADLGNFWLAGFSGESHGAQ